jgi:integrase
MDSKSQRWDAMEALTGGGVSARFTLEQAIARLDLTYTSRGWSRDLWANDRALLRRIGKDPDDITLEDLERVVLTARARSTKAQYTARIHSLFKTMRQVGITQNRAEEQLPAIRKPRATPRPITKEQAHRLMTEAKQPMRDWFTLACLAGLRACEIARVTGDDLIDHGDGTHSLRILGKGNTDITVPVVPQVADVFLRQATDATLWPYSHPRKISARACAEMRRLGIPAEKAKLHGCRHYFATTLLEASGWDLLTTSRLMRHANLNTTTGYTALRTDRPREVLELLAAC